MVTLRHPSIESILQVILIFVLKIIHLFTKLKFFPRMFRCQYIHNLVATGFSE